jgi:hypothetical protein
MRTVVLMWRLSMPALEFVATFLVALAVGGAVGFWLARRKRWF